MATRVAPPPAGTLYDKAFRKHAKSELSQHQYAKVHAKAFRSAGGMSPKAKITKDQPVAADIHVKVPLGSKSPKKKIKRRGSLLARVIKAALQPRPERVVKSLADATSLLRRPSGRRGHLVRKSNELAPIVDANAKKQIVYCVALEPDEFDDHNDTMDPADIEYTAHRFLTHSRTIGSMHQQQIAARPVESYIAPTDITFRKGMYGPQTIKKGSWVLGIHVQDPKEWAKVVSGHYKGISVGGFGLRKELDA